MWKYTPGYDRFTPDSAETFEHKNCQVCGTLFDIKKSVDGPTTIGEARIGKSHIHDVLTCPNSGTEWHDQALDILREIEKTASDDLGTILSAELVKIIVSQKATKAGYKRKI